MRADLLLVEKGLAPSRNRAQELISNGKVFVVAGDKRRLVTKASAQLELADKVEIDQEGLRFVSRGGFKMQGALERTKLKLRHARVLDVGISTGGFADCVLQAGAKSVIGLDVGHDQLAVRLRADPRVRVFEGVNARDLSQIELIEANGGHRFDLIVIDVSFISLTLVLPGVIQYLCEAAALLALVKPQFEVGREGLGKNGIVKDPRLYKSVEEKIRQCCSASSLMVEDYFESSIEGSDGNVEFFALARPAQLALDIGAVDDDSDSARQL